MIEVISNILPGCQFDCSFKEINMQKTALFITIGLGFLSIMFTSVWAAGDNSTNMPGKMDHSAMGMKMDEENPIILPKEGGQAAFATIAEIVALLKSNPDTDWTKVNINALREHLIDMNELTLNTTVETTVSSQNIEFSVSGKGRTIRAIQNMVPAHSAVLRSGNFYDATAEVTKNGAIIRVAFTSENQRDEITALGFYGLMATGAQHQAHHLQMALGNM